MEAVTLRTPRLILRPWREADLEPFARLNADPEVSRFAPAPLDPAGSDALARSIMAHFQEHGWGFWAVEEAGGAPFLGFIGLAVARFQAPFTPCVETGWRLAPSHWGRGLAPEGARAALDFAFGTVGLEEVVAFTTHLNQPSMRVMAKVGMVRDPQGDFQHPDFPPGHPLRPHVLYRIRNPALAPADRR